MPASKGQGETIAFLSDPATYGLPGPVERIDTHAAMVFLAGDHAYKLKRAVRFPYLDFSTPDKRRAVCEAELELNRRTAPEIYLRVASIGRNADGRLALDAGAPVDSMPVDWVVVMRRFSADCLLDTMARRGPLADGLIRDLADRIAGFHASADVVPGDGAARARAVIDGNRAAMAALAPGLLPAADCERLHARALALLGSLAPLLDRRAAEGQVRHCHGDLHLANICLWEGRPTLFDCLEFDDALATTDVLYDLAFVLMDLWQRGLHGNASLLFNRYCDMRGESGGLAAMPLFLSMRAAVRAHVEASAVERQAGDAARQEKLRTARAYLAAAMDFLDRPQPRLIAVGGLSGTGKSTLAARLAPLAGAAPGARWLRSDVLRKRMAGVRPEQPLPAEAYAPERGRAVYRRLLDDTGQLLAAGTTVIVDAVFARPDERAAIMQAASAAGASFHGLWLEAPTQVMRRRVDARRGDASDADAAVVERQLDYALGDLSGWYRTDASGSPDEVLARASAVLAGPAAS